MLNGRKISQNDMKIIKLLLMRFEVSKRLYSKYSMPDIKRASDDYGILKNYSLFGLLLCRLVHRGSNPENLIWMNAMLKINDLMISSMDKESGKLVHKMQIILVHLEMDLINHEFARISK